MSQQPDYERDGGVPLLVPADPISQHRAVSPSRNEARRTTMRHHRTTLFGTTMRMSERCRTVVVPGDHCAECHRRSSVAWMQPSSEGDAGAQSSTQAFDDRVVNSPASQRNAVHQSDFPNANQVLACETRNSKLVSTASYDKCDERQHVHEVLRSSDFDLSLTSTSNQALGHRVR